LAEATDVETRRAIRELVPRNLVAHLNSLNLPSRVVSRLTATMLKVTVADCQYL
jgi:hypothetical protein